MVEGAGLENLYTRKGIEGSNPSLSASSVHVQNYTATTCDFHGRMVWSGRDMIELRYTLVATVRKPVHIK